MDKSKKRILVTGGAGFIGSNFILYWIKNHPQDQIINFDDLTYAGNLENLVSVEKNPNYKFIKGNIAQPQEVDPVMEDIDIVVYFGAETHVDRSILGPQPFVLSNVVGTQVLLDSARKNNIKRFHHVSSDEVFGQLSLDSHEKFNESTPYNPRSPYSASKAASDHLVRSYYHTFNLPITITNSSNNFGPFQFPEKFIPLSITNLIEGKKIPVYGDGLYVRDWLYVDDHCRAIDLVLQKGKIGQTYVVGGMTTLYPNIEIAKKIVKLLGKDENSIEFVKDRPGHDRKYDVDWSKIKSELGWQPLHDFDEWLRETVRWYKDNEDWWRKVKSGEYQNYYKKQYVNE